MTTVTGPHHRPQGHILYVDHANHLTPLTLAYHATASRHLTSGRPDVIPPSTTAEVDSAYCPQCLAFEAASATSGVCHRECGGCKSCPICFSPLSKSIDETIPSHSESNNSRLICHYACGYCQWSSRECGVTSNADKLQDYASTSDEIEESKREGERKLAIAEISKELDLCLQQRLSERNKVGDDLFYSIAKMWAKREEEEKQRNRMKIGIFSSSKDDVDNRGSSWSLEILEHSLMQKKIALNSPSSIVGVACDPGKDDIQFSKATSTIINQLPTSQQMAAQMTITSTTPKSRSDLIPLPVHFRARVSRRCRKELAEGRTGILMKSKQNPLDGDSSLRSGHGQWFMKDSSAVHVVPNVHLHRVGVDVTSHKYAALLKVKNPTLNMIRLRLTGPSRCETMNEKGESTTHSYVQYQNELQHVLVNPFTETYVQGCATDATVAIIPTDFFVLNPAEDPLLDTGKVQTGDPLEVKDWDGITELSTGNWGESQFRTVAIGGDTAWVELLLCNAIPMMIESSRAANNINHLAVPFALQIEVGNGSWEASLIKRQDLPEQEHDLVTLNLVALFS